MNNEHKLSFWQAIIVSIITAIGGIATGYIALPHKAEPIEKQGLSEITLEGKWKYICTAFDGSYQHGGRFVVQKEKDGSLILNGERMWKDTYNSTSRTWDKIEYKESDYLLWHTNWIFVRNNTEMNFEYHIPMQNSELIGYCTGHINADNNEVVCVKGNFYVLNQNPILTGQIIFKKVTEGEYHSNYTLPKNH